MQPNKTQRRPGYHSDAYETEETDSGAAEGKTADNTYVVYDAIPTHFQPGPFPLAGVVDPEDCSASGTLALIGLAWLQWPPRPPQARARGGARCALVA